MEREWSVKEIIEDLRNWEQMFNSESETKWLMNKAADIIEFYIDTNHYIESQHQNGPRGKE